MTPLSRIIELTYNKIEFHIAYKIREGGSGLIFFIHGLGCAKELFDDVWNFTGLNDYTIVTVDLPGFGDSGMPDAFSGDLQDHAQICRCLISRLPERRIHIVGHSMGGAVGLLLSDMIHDRLESFVNVEGNLISHDCEVSRRKVSVTFEEFEKKKLPGLILLTSISDQPGMRLWSTYIKKADRKGFYRSSRSLVNWSDSGRLLKAFRKLGCKKVYVYGETNSFLKLITMLDGIPTVSISQSGHFPMNDNPGEFYDVLAGFICS